VPSVLAAWDFDFKSEVVWDKQIPGTGYWTRGQHEKLLLCRRGKMPDLHGERCPPSVYRERRGEHSAKPDYFYSMIERAYPEYVRLPPAAPLMIELFRRGEDESGNAIPLRPGWAAWGNQAQAREVAA
jgi:N6-adenosine-specific RNA methylase IME4